jgi:hypothetical protein
VQGKGSIFRSHAIFLFRKRNGWHVVLIEEEKGIVEAAKKFSDKQTNSSRQEEFEDSDSSKLLSTTREKGGCRKLSTTREKGGCRKFRDAKRRE